MGVGGGGSMAGHVLLRKWWLNCLNLSEYIQGGFNTLTGLFEQVGRRENVRKTFRMICHPCHAVRKHLDVSYE